jgi:EAL domain-containing protein (putative c-di-GMP-specific phosphodiesterase class I)
MLQAGAVGYVVKGGPADEILDAVRRAARGESTLSPSLSGEVIGMLRQGAKVPGEEIAERAEARKRIEDVLERKTFVSVFQPIVELADRVVAGHEALTRFVDKDLGNPAECFADAHEAGLGKTLEVATLRAALGTMKASGWPNGDGGFLSLNAAPAVATDPAFRAAIAGLEPGRVVIEITEHAAIENYLEFEDKLASLREEGVRLAVDDAGAGFASLRHILRLAPDLIKLDMTLTRDIDSDPARRAMASAMISFAGETGADVVAEGIETEAELEVIRSLGARYGQGYLLGRPGPPQAGNGDSA